ncbi:MAG TPA: alpha/beta fold hydrolase [Stenomitos sp.]
MNRLSRLCAATVLALALSPVSLPGFAQAAPAVMAAQPLGVWKGELKLPGRSLSMEFTFQPAADGTWSGTFFVPGQTNAPLSFSKVTVEAGHLVAEAAMAHATYEAQLSPDGKTLIGQWKQNGAVLDLTMAHQESQTVLRRPQDPVPPFPYTQEEVSYVNPQGPVQLAGTLTMPRTQGPHPAVLLITGSGAQDRDETILGHRPFRLIADDLTRRGFAVLRVDDRGVGGSTGSVIQSTTADFALDVKAGLRFLQSRPEIDRRHIGLVGHSEGGLIAPMVAAGNPDVAFVVLLAGPGMRGDATIQAQSEAIARKSGASEAQLKSSQDVQRQLLAIAAGPTPREQAIPRMRALLATQVPNDGSPDSQAKWKQLDAQLEAMLTPWYRYFLTCDPLPYLRKVTCPVLALNGENDTQVLYRLNLGPIERALKEGGNRDVTVQSFPQLNHLFQTSQTGLLDEYATIEETFAPVALKTMGDWLERHARR